MADRDTPPDTSTVREALAIVADADVLWRHDELSGQEFVDTLDDLMARARALRPHQVGDVIEHLRARYQHPAPSTPQTEPVPLS